MKLDDLLIESNRSVKQVLAIIEKNHQGGVIVVDDDNCLKGTITDGDIRRLVLNGQIHDSMSAGEVANTSCEFVDEGSALDTVLKKLDTKVKILPVVDQFMHVVDVVTRTRFPPIAEKPFVVCGRAPARVSFAGGGTDLTRNFAGRRGAVLTAAISLFARAELVLNGTEEIRVISDDLNESHTFSSFDEIAQYRGPLQLLVAAISVMKPSFGFTLRVSCDFPVGSGLGGSSAVVAVVLGCLNRCRLDQLSQSDIASLAFRVERIEVGIPGGWQDQYASIYGGVNTIDFSSETTIVQKTMLSSRVIAELEDRLILVSVGGRHDSGKIHQEAADDGNTSIATDEFVREAGDLFKKFTANLLGENLKMIGALLDQGWKLKKASNPLVTSPEIDRIYDQLINHGADGGRLLGAGKAGYFLTHVPRSRQSNLLNFLKASGLGFYRFNLANEGLSTWTITSDEY